VAAAVVNAVQGTFFYGPLFSAVQDLAPPRGRATAVAVLIFGHNLLGLAPGSFAAGWLCDWLTGRVAQPITWGLAAVGLTGLLAVPLFFFAAKRTNHRDTETQRTEDREGGK
jgi:MFS family permease